MKIYYIPPKTTKPKKRSIKLYSNILSLFSIISCLKDKELAIILIIVILLAIVAAAQNILMIENKTDKWDKKLKDYEKKKKIEKMLEDTKDKSCKNVNPNNLI